VLLLLLLLPVLAYDYKTTRGKGDPEDEENYVYTNSLQNFKNQRIKIKPSV
jgi:hypothetical protein